MLVRRAPIKSHSPPVRLGETGHMLHVLPHWALPAAFGKVPACGRPPGESPPPTPCLVELDAEVHVEDHDVLHLDLRRVVHNELVVHQPRRAHALRHLETLQVILEVLVGPTLTHGYLRPTGERAGALGVGARLAHTVARVLLGRHRALCCLGVGRKTLVLLPQGDVAQRQHAGGVGAGPHAVVSRLTHHVSEVDALAEHVAGDGRLGRGDAQAFGEDPHPVGEAAAVPQQHAVLPRPRGQGAHACGEASRLALARGLEDVLDLEAVGVVRGRMRLRGVLDDHGDLFGRGRLEPAAEPLVVGVVRVLRLRLCRAELLGDGGRRDGEE
mmetsp:Transcript_14546/g.34326  ORF Transcript_14546/g.34326 Transcript_14546/m.34326 type:complete len:327 (+) Transcript_14546:134-1114(+)